MSHRGSMLRRCIIKFSTVLSRNLRQEHVLISVADGGMAGDTVHVKLADKQSSTNGNDEWWSQVADACKYVKQGEVVAVPTDTIYGIAGLAQSSDAVDRIYNIKNRDTSNPVAICVGNVEDVGKWGRVTISSGLLRELLPGPVTVVFERTLTLNPHLNPGTTLVGIRVPDHGFVRDVASECGQPLALTSANPSGSPSTLSTEEFSGLWPQLRAVFDGGRLGEAPASRTGSTVVDLSNPGTYTIIRPGSAHRETTEKLQRYGLQEKAKR